MHISKLSESKYLRKEDCDPPILVTIATVEEKNIAKEGEKPDIKWLLHVDELDKPMVLNATNGQLIAQITGSEETDEWSGRKIVLYNDPSVSFGGKLMGGIRVRAPKGAKAKPALATQINEDGDPF